MKYITYSEEATYKVAILVKETSFQQSEIYKCYVEPLINSGVPKESIIVYSLAYNEVNKAPATFIKEYMNELLDILQELHVEYLYVTDQAYFKVLTKVGKANPHFGYILTCNFDTSRNMKVILGINHQALIFNPELQQKIDLSLDTLLGGLAGTHQELGSTIIHSAYYPESKEAILEALRGLHEHPMLAVDIEAFSLRFNEAGIGTISFAWNEHNGIAFAVDYSEFNAEGVYLPNRFVREALRAFFCSYKGNLVAHNCTYDFKVFIYNLWMNNDLDTKGLLTGLDILTRKFDDTKIIAYLATNSTAGNVLGLKELAHEFAGNWAVEVKDIRKIPLDKLLKYNLVDSLSTLFVYNKYYPIMVQDQQETLYKELMLPSLKLIIQLELTGMSMSSTKIIEARNKLEEKREHCLSTIYSSAKIIEFNNWVQKSAMDKANAKLKTKQHPIEKFKDLTFNPNSGPQLQELLYEQFKLPVIDYTDNKNPATGGDTLDKLINHTEDEEVKEILRALIGYNKVDKILSTFIPAFERGIYKDDGMQYLHGSFHVGGTVSGRLAGSDPNLTNLPSGSYYGALVKECFVPPPGWLMIGADFNSLEDMISALTTRDINKLKVYLDGYCGHCLRAYSYFPDECIGIENTVESINSIKKLYPELRQLSKIPTFLLTYAGTHHGIVNSLGWTLEKAKDIEEKYHILYKESDEYIQAKLLQASKDGYVDVAFGLRVRTPLLKQVVYGKNMLYQAAAEGRTAGNAMGQSFCQLNNRASIEFMRKVWESEYRYDVKPISLIHDAQYYLVRDHVDVVHWVNKELIKSMQWQELPEIQHDQVKLGATMEIYWPAWNNKVTIPNGASKGVIMEICTKARKEYKE